MNYCRADAELSRPLCGRNSPPSWWPGRVARGGGRGAAGGGEEGGKGGSGREGRKQRAEKKKKEIEHSGKQGNELTV